MDCDTSRSRATLLRLPVSAMRRNHSSGLSSISALHYTQNRNHGCHLVKPRGVRIMRKSRAAGDQRRRPITTRKEEIMAKLPVYKIADIPREKDLHEGRMTRWSMRTKDAQIIFAEITP